MTNILHHIYYLSYILGHGGAIKSQAKAQKIDDEPSSKKDIRKKLPDWVLKTLRKTLSFLNLIAGFFLDLLKHAIEIVIEALNSRTLLKLVKAISSGINQLFSSHYFKHASVVVVFVLILINNVFAQNTKSLNEQISFESNAEAKKLSYASLVEIVESVDYYTIIDERSDELPEALKTTGEVLISGDGFVAKPNVVLALEADADIKVENESSSKRGNSEYVVKEGDTLGGIASAFGVKVSTIKFANNLSNIDVIKPGSKLLIPGTDGMIHTVKAGETLTGIVKKYRGNYEKTLVENSITEGDKIYIGQKILVVDGKYIPPPPKPRLARTNKKSYKNVYQTPRGSFVFPTSRGTYYNGYHWWAIDIPRPTGTAVYAADAGRIVTAGWSGSGYGRYIVIDHGNGYKTLYAHLSSVKVGAGQYVGQGQTIGGVGSTGRSTGSHLHFEISYRGRRLNPINYVR